MNQNERYYPGQRASTPQGSRAFESPYDVSSETLQDMVQRGIKPYTVIQQSLAAASITPESSAAGVTAPTQGEWLEFKMPGNHICMFGSDSSTNQAVNTTAFVEVLTQSERPAASDIGFPVKHNRGISGPFERFWVRWPAQVPASITARIVVFRYQGRPWINGEAAT